jgi:hypothetical protein
MSPLISCADCGARFYQTNQWLISARPIHQRNVQYPTEIYDIWPPGLGYQCSGFTGNHSAYLPVVHMSTRTSCGFRLYRPPRPPKRGLVEIAPSRAPRQTDMRLTGARALLKYHSGPRSCHCQWHSPGSAAGSGLIPTETAVAPESTKKPRDGQLAGFVQITAKLTCIVNYTAGVSLACVN